MAGRRADCYAFICLSGVRRGWQFAPVGDIMPAMECGAVIPDRKAIVIVAQNEVVTVFLRQPFLDANPSVPLLRGLEFGAEGLNLKSQHFGAVVQPLPIIHVASAFDRLQPFRFRRRTTILPLLRVGLWGHWVALWTTPTYIK
jgi:hypothetical protein